MSGYGDDIDMFGDFFTDPWFDEKEFGARWFFVIWMDSYGVAGRDRICMPGCQS